MSLRCDGRGPRCLLGNSGDRGFEPRCGIQVSKKQTVSSLFTRKDSILWGASVTEKLVASSVSDRQGSNFEPVSREKCHLIHLTIIRRFPWPSLAYMSAKVA